jgi:hypothetical protein
LESDIAVIEGISEKPPEGAQPSDNIDNDAGEGPAKRDTGHGPYKRNVEANIDENEDSTETDKDKKEGEEEDTVLYTMDHVYYVYDTPKCVPGLVQVAIVVSAGNNMLLFYQYHITCT